MKIACLNTYRGQFRPLASLLLASVWGLPSRGQPMLTLREGNCMFITVLVTVCLTVAVPGTCMTEPVVNSIRSSCNGRRLGYSASSWPRNFGSIICSITLGNSRAGPASSAIALRRPRQGLVSTKSQGCVENQGDMKRRNPIVIPGTATPPALRRADADTRARRHR